MSAEPTVDLWLARPPSTAGPRELARCAALCSAEERARAARYRGADRRAQCLAAWALARLALADRTGAPPRGLRFERSPRERPRLVDGGPDFNLTHCAGFAACAVAEGLRVGVDAEPRSRVADMRRVASRFVAPTERGADLVRLWTLKEALAKGVGLGVGLDFVRLAFDLRGRPVCPAAPRWRFHETASEGVAVALAWRGAEAQVRVRDATGLLFGA